MREKTPFHQQHPSPAPKPPTMPLKATEILESSMDHLRHYKDPVSFWLPVFGLHWNMAFSGHFDLARDIMELFFSARPKQFTTSLLRELQTLWDHAPSAKPTNLPSRWPRDTTPYPRVSEVPFPSQPTAPPPPQCSSPACVLPISKDQPPTNNPQIILPLTALIAMASAQLNEEESCITLSMFETDAPEGCTDNFAIKGVARLSDRECTDLRDVGGFNSFTFSDSEGLFDPENCRVVFYIDPSCI
jgi:hypothetical protein